MYPLLTQILHRLPPESAHHLAIKLLRYFPVQSVIADLDTQLLTQTVMGMNFAHPLGLAAGFDKDAEVFDSLGQLGFSFLEIGSVTPRPQPGNPKPRLFRLTDEQAIINRYGFNSLGLDYVAKQFLRHQRQCIVGINLGKNKDSQDPIADFLQGAEKLVSQADYFTINVSSPNTPGLRDLQTPEILEAMIKGLLAITKGDRKSPLQSNSIPLLVKISPDLTLQQETELIEFLVDSGIDGIVISNTTLSREGIPVSALSAESGGLSGPPLKNRSTAMLQRAYQKTQGRIALIGSGGISNGLDAYEKLCAGADLLQIYTAFVYQGPLVIRKILTELNTLLERDGVRNIQEIIGSAVEK